MHKKEPPPSVIIENQAWARTCTLNHSSLIWCAEGLIHAKHTRLLIGASPRILFAYVGRRASAKYPEAVLSRTAVPLRFVQMHDKFMKMQRT